MKFSVDNIAQPGFVPDVPDQLLPAGAWTDSRNVQFRDGALEKCKGYTQALGNLSATAIWVAAVSDGTNYFWVYGSNTVLYATDGTTHANVSHASLTYAASDDNTWTGGAFHGYMIACDGVGIPQSWTPSLSNDFESLTAWPVITCKVVRPFKDFLFAFRITDGGDYNPRAMRWSDRAPQGELPQSWDFADPTNQAGINELGQTGDAIVDALPLRDSLIIYKEQHTWIADYIGAPDVFSFRQVFSQIGMFTENCAVAFGSQHLVWTDSDIILHDGSGAQSIIDARARKWLFNRINTNRYKRCFAVADHRNRQAFFCFPESGADWPTLALVWNWQDNTLHPIELGGPKTFAIPGIVTGASITFDADTGTFDEASGAFDDETFSPFQSRVVMLDAQAPRAYQNDSGETFNGTPMNVYAERTGMTLTKDLSMLKRIKRLFPKVIGTTGDTLRFYIGARSSIGAATQWFGPYTFRIGIDYKIDLRVTARLLDLRLEYTGSDTFRFYSFDVEHEQDGTR